MSDENINQLNQDDFLVLEENLETQEIPLDEAISGNRNLLKLRNIIAATKAAKSGLLPFLGAVKLDLERRQPIGLKSLFSVWLERGNNYWLNPMDPTHGFGVLHEILYKYQGDMQILSPIVELLTHLARNDISPRAFIEFVILPRMREDFNWRKWREKHLEALQIIAHLIIAEKGKPPFNQEHLGSGKTKLAIDIVLVKYLGRPLAQFQLVQLRDTELLDRYMAAWQRVTLKEPLSLYFMRSNALHFFYSMSGKIDLIQLILLVEQLPYIERAFAQAFPDGNIKLKKIQSINLYDYDIDYAINQKKQNGFRNFDFVTEISAYFEIVKALLRKPTGVYLCAFYAGLLRRYKDPIIAQTISRLVNIIDDRGGLHIYKWHTRKLFSHKKVNMDAYIDHIERNNGCDPEYPRLYLLFRDEAAARATQDVINLAESFGLQNYFVGKDSNVISYRELLNAYIQKYPDTGEVIFDFQEKLLYGQDRHWNTEYTKRLDLLRSSDKSLFGPLMRSVIRGIGTGWTTLRQKAPGFSDLLRLYNTAQTQMLISVRTQFKIPIKPIGSTSAENDAIARKQINMVQVEKIWRSLCNKEQVDARNTIAFINKWTMDIDKPLQNAFETKISYEEDLRKNEEQEIREKLEKDIAKLDRTINTLQTKKQNYTTVMDEFDSLNDEQKFITTLILAGTSGKPDDSYSDFVIRLLLQRYKHLEIITSRVSFLADDLCMDALSYQQLTFLLNLLDTLFFALHEDTRITDLLNEETTILQEILSPYLITKRKEVTIDALDAAGKKMAGYASMQAERAKWQEIIESMEEKSDKYFHDMELYTSKSFIDSHYGDMGGICLSSRPEEILRPGFYVQRLADLTDKQIIGMSILYLSAKGFMAKEKQARNYWQAFGFNPLASVLCHLTAQQQLDLYLQYRLNMEKIAWKTKLPVVISGIGTYWGLISNNEHFGNLIRTYEVSKPTAIRVNNAKGISVYYSEKEFSNALVIIDPRGYERAIAPSQVPTFYAHKELGIETFDS